MLDNQLIILNNNSCKVGGSMVQLCRPYGEGITCLCDQAKAVLKWGNTIYLLLLHLVLFHIHGVKKKMKGCIEYRRYSFVFSLSHLLLTRILTAGVFSPATNKLLALQKTHRWYFVAYFLLVAGFYWPIKGSLILLLWSFYPQSLYGREGLADFPAASFRLIDKLTTQIMRVSWE